MSWLRSSPLRNSLNRSGSTTTTSSIPKFALLGNSSSSSNSIHQSSSSTSSSSQLRQRPIDTATDCDPRACYDSFCKHWQQAYEIIQHSEPPHKPPPTHDDVLGVVSHLDFMVTLLLVELHHCNKIALPTTDSSTPPPAPCLEFMLSENLLDKLYEWGCTTGRYANAVRLEQLKLYELLVSHSRHQLLCHEPFLRPLLKILASSQGEIFPPDLEKRLVILLNQLCVVLMQNVHLLDLFFFSAQAQVQERGIQTKSGTTTNFIIFSLLIPYVHREGSLGHQARDALLLCMALSQKNSNIGTYIAQYSSMCPLLVTGLGGLYSRLPNSIEITSIDWHRITPDDVTEIPELTLFMNALEFCNAVVQVAHEMIKQQLLDFMYQGFIVPVLGPAILQTLNGKHLQTNADSQISAMSYLDLILRSITEPGLLRLFIKFLLDNEKFDGERILDSLVERLNSPDANLCMVTMALFDTLLGLHCEDLMLELMLKYMLPGKHVPISYRHKINKIDPYINSAEFFLDLTPDVMKRARELTRHKNLGETVSAQIGSSYNNSTTMSATMSPTTTSITTTTTTTTMPSPTSTMSKTIGANWNYYGLYTADSLYANIHAYLFEAHWRIAQCQRDCEKWANSYKYQKWPRNDNQRNTMHALELVKQFFSEFSNTTTTTTTTINCSILSNTGIDSVASDNGGDKKQLDSLQSIGESSGYESFKWRPTDEDVDANDNANGNGNSNGNGNILSTTSVLTLSSSGETATDILDSSSSTATYTPPTSTTSIGGTASIKREPWRVSNNRNELVLSDLDFSEDLFAQGTVSLGPFLNAILAKLQTFTSNTLYVNLHLTGLITRLTWYPLPLVHSLLLRPDIAITSDTPSFHQVLRILKQQIDAELPVTEDSLEIVDIARSYLIDREFRLVNARKASENSPVHTVTNAYASNAHHHHHHHQQTHGQQRSTYSTISAATPVQATPTNAYDPFRRNDNKRRSISKSITSMFSRKSSTTPTISTTTTTNSSTNSGGAVSSLVNNEANGGGGASSGGNNFNEQTTRMPTIGTNNTCETSLSTISPAQDRRRLSDRSAMQDSGGAAAAARTTMGTTTTRLQNISSSSNGLSSDSGERGSNVTLSAHSSLTLTSIGSTLLGGGGGGIGDSNASVGVSGGGNGVTSGFGSEPASLESMSSMGAIANTSGSERSRDLALCAVLLDEWLKELAAVAQEQSVVLVNISNSL